MINILVLGATGSIARVAVPLFLQQPEVQLTLFVRSARKLGKIESDRGRVVEGDVLDTARLREAMAGQDVVYANLSGELERMAAAVVAAMHDTGVRRLIFISSMGIYGEVPGQKYRSILDPYRKAAEVVEASDLDFTILRPGWFTDEDDVDYEITQEGEPFKGYDVSRASVASLVVKLATTPGLEVRRSLGVSKSEVSR